jgi:hypothetical protein
VRYEWLGGGCAGRAGARDVRLCGACLFDGFQVSLAGMKELLHMEQALRDQVDIFSVPGHPFPAELKLIK